MTAPTRGDGNVTGPTKMAPDEHERVHFLGGAVSLTKPRVRKLAGVDKPVTRGDAHDCVEGKQWLLPQNPGSLPS
jgi:hypothetical protein